tara:strand:- start:1240 stop:2187 length:948 start_codon:yes stop_codon:yes gene_type:complete
MFGQLQRTSFVLVTLFILSLVPSVQSQGDIYPWELEIDYPNDEESNPFELSRGGTTTITFFITNDGPLSIDVTFEYEGPFQGQYSGPEEGTIAGNSNESFILKVSQIDVLDYAARTQDTFLITANLVSIQGTPQISSSTKESEGNLEIPIVYSLNLEINDPIGPMNAGANMMLRAIVTNEGNIEDRVGEVEISDNCPLLTPNNGLDSLMTLNLNSGKSAQADLELSASESHPRRNCKVEITISSNGAMNTGSSSLVSAEVQVEVDPPLQDSNSDDTDDSTTTTTEVIGSSLPSSSLLSAILCIVPAVAFRRSKYP